MIRSAVALFAVSVDLLQRFGNLTVWSVGFCVLTWAFAITAVLGLVPTLRARGSGVPPGVYAHALAITRANAVVAVYLAYWGVIGFRSWLKARPAFRRQVHLLSSPQRFAMILERVSPLRLIDMESALRRAVRRRRASIAAVEQAGAATVFTILHPDLYGALLAADARFAALLPCRIAAYAAREEVRLAAVSPVAFARGFGRADLEAIAASAEGMLNDILDQATRPLTQAAAGGHAESGLGATEDQMNMRGAVPQRIDSRGSKVEELAGTGEQDSRGG